MSPIFPRCCKLEKYYTNCQNFYSPCRTFYSQMPASEWIFTPLHFVNSSPDKQHFISEQKEKLFRTFTVGKNYCYMTPIKDLLWLAETSFHWLWQILMSTSDELKLVQDRSTSRFVSAARQLKIDWTKFSPGQVDITFFTAARTQEIAWFLMYIQQVKCFKLSFYENSNLKNAIILQIRVSETWKAIVEIILFSMH